MNFWIALAGLSLALGISPAMAQGPGGGPAREACREEAKMNVRPSRTSRLDREQIREMRRSYVQDCMKRARG